MRELCGRIGFPDGRLVYIASGGPSYRMVLDGELLVGLADFDFRRLLVDSEHVVIGSPWLLHQDRCGHKLYCSVHEVKAFRL